MSPCPNKEDGSVNVPAGQTAAPETTTPTTTPTPTTFPEACQRLNSLHSFGGNDYEIGGEDDDRDDGCNEDNVYDAYKDACFDDHFAPCDHHNDDFARMIDDQDSDTNHNEDDGADVGDGANGKWFTIADLQSLAKTIYSNIPPAVDGLANVIHRSALTVVTELKNGLEPDDELDHEDDENDHDDNHDHDNHQHNNDTAVLTNHHDLDDNKTPPTENDQTPRHQSHNYVMADAQVLPWEVLPSGEIAVDVKLRDKIRQLSLTSTTFTSPYSATSEITAADLTNPSFIDKTLIQRLLGMDNDLVTMHCKLLSGGCEVKEHYFWKNYFYHCNKVREQHQHAVIQQDVDSEADEPNPSPSESCPTSGTSSSLSSLTASKDTTTNSSTSLNSSCSSLLGKKTFSSCFPDDTIVMPPSSSSPKTTILEPSATLDIVSPAPTLPLSISSVDDFVLVDYTDNDDNDDKDADFERITKEEIYFIVPTSSDDVLSQRSPLSIGVLE